MSGMCRLIVAVLTMTLASGCVMGTYDPRIHESKPARAELKDFAGTYKDSAIYFTPPNGIGLEGFDSLGDMLRGYDFKSDVQIESTNSGDIFVKASHDRFDLPAIHYIKGKDFDFTNCCVVFHSKTHTQNDETIGIYQVSMVWMLDNSGNLVVSYGGKGAGFLTIIPVVAFGSTLSVFPRAETNIDIMPAK